MHIKHKSNVSGDSGTVHIFEQNRMLKSLFGAEPWIAGPCIIKFVSMQLFYPHSFLSLYLGQEFELYTEIKYSWSKKILHYFMVQTDWFN